MEKRILFGNTCWADEPATEFIASVSGIYSVLDGKPLMANATTIEASTQFQFKWELIKVEKPHPYIPCWIPETIGDFLKGFYEKEMPPWMKPDETATDATTDTNTNTDTTTDTTDTSTTNSNNARIL
jgi:hypothetical protein